MTAVRICIRYCLRDEMGKPAPVISGTAGAESHHGSCAQDQEENEYIGGMHDVWIPCQGEQPYSDGRESVAASENSAAALFIHPGSQVMQIKTRDHADGNIHETAENKGACGEAAQYGRDAAQKKHGC